MMRFYFLIILSVFWTSFSFGQIIEGNDTLYGNEWINYDQQYIKILVAEDGLYRVSGQELSDAGVPTATVNGSAFQLFHNGVEVPVRVSTNDIFSPDDFLEFYGEKNRSELDRHLFSHGEQEMMNPEYSLINDSSAYFLTWSLTASGKRYVEQANTLGSEPPNTPWCWRHSSIVYTDRLRKETDAHGIALSNYTRAEGYATDFKNAFSETGLAAKSPYTGNVDAQLRLRYSGSLGQHQLQIQVNGEVLDVAEFQGYEVGETSFSLPNAWLAEPLSIQLNGLVSNNDKFRLAFLDLKYPAAFQFAGESSVAFSLPASTTPRIVEINGLNTNGGTILYNLSAGYFLVPEQSAGVLKLSLPPSAVEEEFLLVNQTDGVKSGLVLTPVTFRDFSNLEAEYIIISNRRLFGNGSGENYVQQYADFRSSAAGGGYSSIIVDIQELYDQFSWGINRHPLSIRNFIWWVKHHWPNPRFVLLVGKGLEYHRIRSAGNLAASPEFYLPTWGTPGSDNLLVAGPDGFTPLLPIGRIACWNTEDLAVYLDKIKAFEANANKPQSLQDRLWMKNILHLGGGFAGNAGEQQTIRSYLENFAGILAESKFGAHAMAFYKTSTDPIQQPQSDLIFDYINNGVSLVTFFGHSGIGVFDLSIDFPENYHNKDKYYWMISLGCYAGNIHTNVRGIGERFVFLKDGGPIAFTATAGQGFLTSLNTFSTEIYQLLGNDLYGHAIGEILQSTIANFNSGNYGIDLIRQQFNLLGDPAVKLNPAPGPDYVVDPSSVRVFPERIAANQRTFDLNLAVANLGQNLPDSIRLEIVHKLPDGTQRPVLDTLLPAPAYREEYRFTLPPPGKEAIGQNRLLITVDAGNRLDELPLPAAETNNELIMPDGQKGFPFFVSDNSAVPAYPPEFAIVDHTGITLKAYTTDPLAPERRYLFQLDTTESFNSPLLMNHTLTQRGGVLKWEPQTDWMPGQVYFWRVSPDSISPQEGYLWNASSFVVEPGQSPGWNQSHGQQFQKNAMVNLEASDQGKWDFPQLVKEFILTNAPRSIQRPGLLLNNYTSWWYYYTPAAGYYITWIDSVYLEPKWNRYPGQYGLLHPWQQDATVFMFNSDANGRKQAMDFLTNVIPEGDYVLFATMQNTPSSNYHPDEWVNDSLTYGYSLLNILENDGGAQLARQLPTVGSVPYAVAYRKGHGLVAEKMASSAEEIMELKFGLEGNWDRGFFTTPPIGPASSWQKIKIAVQPDPTASDTLQLELLGIKADGSRTTLLQKLLATEEEIDISGLNTAEFPLLAVQVYFEDSLLRTAPQLKYLKVYYSGTPEYAFNPQHTFELTSDSLQQGAPLQLQIAIENLADTDASDSLLIAYTLRNKANQVSTVSQKMLPLQGGEQRTLNFEYDTRNQKGEQFLGIELNPDYKPERLHINNFLDLDYRVFADTMNPLLDVTFDGRRILDGELVSSKPHIEIRLKDENPYRPLDDTALIRLAIGWPDSANLTPLYFNQPGLSWQFSNDPSDNYLQVTYEPVLTRDGEYTLVVQAKDKSGNASGGLDFKQRFRVMTKKALSNFVNYPNPFSTSTRFVYTLTGDAPPADYRLQISTISGRIVREVSKEELGPLRVGTHMTDFAWDGKDQFGDQLATGVYLYRLLISDDDTWEAFETAADRFTTGGVGKMVLIR